MYFIYDLLLVNSGKRGMVQEITVELLPSPGCYLINYMCVFACFVCLLFNKTYHNNEALLEL